MKGFVRACAALAAAVVGAGCGELPPAIQNRAEVRQIVFLAHSCAVVPISESCQLTVQARDADGRPIFGPELFWRSSNPAVLDVVGSGLSGTVTGLATGTSTVSVATGDGDVRQTLLVRVPLPH